MTDISNLKVKMQTSTRHDLLTIIAAGVVELTILGRCHYDEPDEQRRLRTVNEQFTDCPGTSGIYAIQTSSTRQAVPTGYARRWDCCARPV